jgi:hypothetical protein
MQFLDGSRWSGASTNLRLVTAANGLINTIPKVAINQRKLGYLVSEKGM